MFYWRNNFHLNLKISSPLQSTLLYPGGVPEGMNMIALLNLKMSSPLQIFYHTQVWPLVNHLSFNTEPGLAGAFWSSSSHEAKVGVVQVAGAAGVARSVVAHLGKYQTRWEWHYTLLRSKMDILLRTVLLTETEKIFTVKTFISKQTSTGKKISSWKKIWKKITPILFQHNFL